MLLSRQLFTTESKLRYGNHQVFPTLDMMVGSSEVATPHHQVLPSRVGALKSIIFGLNRSSMYCLSITVLYYASRFMPPEPAYFSRENSHHIKGSFLNQINLKVTTPGESL